MIEKMKYKNQVILIVTIILFTIFIGTSTAMATTAVVDTDTLKLRKEASTDSTVLELLNIGEKLEVLEQTGDWVKVKVKGMTGFVHKDYVEIEQEVNKAEDKDKEPKAEETKIEEGQNTENQNTTVNENTVVEQENNVTEKNNNIVKEQFTIREEVLTSNTNVYILPLINSTKIIELNKDTKIIVMDEVKGWLYVQSEEVNGWIRNNSSEEKVVVNNENQTTNNEEEPEKETEKQEQPTEEQGVIVIEEKVMYVNYSSIYVRKGPGTENEVVETLILNSQVVVTGESGDWYKVKVAGVEGYIAKRLLSNTKTGDTTTRSAEERTEVQITENNEQTEQVVTITTTSKGQEIADYAKQ